MAQQELNLESGLVTDAANQFFSCLSGIIVDTDNAVLFPAEEGCLGPSYIVGNTVLQKRAFNHSLAFLVTYLAELYLVVDFYIGE